MQFTCMSLAFKGLFYTVLFYYVDKRTNELVMVVKDIRALRDSFKP